MSFKVTVSVSAVEALASRIDGAAEVLERSSFRGINRVANKAKNEARRRVLSQVNLTTGYVHDRLAMVPAQAERPHATIVARTRPTRLMTYGGRLVTAHAPRARGDRLRGIPAGQKAAGVSVQVKRGGPRKLLPGAFLIPLRAGKEKGGNDFGIFIRPGSAAHVEAKRTPGVRIGKHRWGGGKLRHLYGPSVDQIFRRMIPDLLPQIQEDLDAIIVQEIETEIRRVLA